VGNMGIGAFLIKGDEAKAMNVGSRESSTGPERVDKKRRLGESGIQKFFKADSMGEQEHDEDFGSHTFLGGDSTTAEKKEAGVSPETPETKSPREATKTLEMPNSSNSAFRQQSITDFMCNRCNQAFDSADALQNHQDWHFAKDLQDSERKRGGSPSLTSSMASSRKAMPSSNKKGGGRSSKPEKGQSKLNFG